MSPLTKVQNEQLRAQTQQKILTAALHLFADTGYGNTTIRMIAKEAGVALGLLYNYFSGKEGVLREIFKSGVSDIQESFQPMLLVSDPYERIEGLIRGSIRQVKNNLEFWRLFYSLRLQPAVVQELAQEIVELNDYLSSALQYHFSMLGAADPAAEARIFVSLIDGVGNHYAIQPDSYPINEVIEALVTKYARA